MRKHLARLVLLFLTVSILLPITAGPAMALVSINGAGSTWSQIALQQWAADVARQGISVNYQGVGSTSGRVFYYQNQIDFAASEIPFTTAYRDATGSVITNEVALARHRPYAYMPDVAGGTSFMYHLTINGQLVTSLRLTPLTVTEIFTGAIKNWDDPAIAKDNPQLNLPNLPVRPVVRSDGSGTTAQFTAYMAAEEPALYNAFCQRVGLDVNPCPSVSLWPDINAVSQQLSDGVADYVAAPYNNGTITYVEYGYAKQRGFPVASMLNAGGYFEQPTAGNVAVALTKATLNPDLTQNLLGVYNNPDPRTYPVSSYSYLIVPTTTAAPFSAAKGLTLSKFILYLVCAGQQEAAELGYSPLPENLVQDAFNVVLKIPGHATPPPINQCDDPTITQGFDASKDPLPTFGDKQGNTPTTVAPVTSNTVSPGGVETGIVTQPTTVTSAVAGGSGYTGGAKVGAKGGKGGTKEVALGASPQGQPQTPTQTLSVQAGPVQVPPARDPLPLLLYVVAGVVALIAIFGPPTLIMYLKKREPA
jgi:phosphate transport system substrate-binding protein